MSNSASVWSALNGALLEVLSAFEKPAQPTAAFDAVDKAIDRVFGRKYVTILAFEGDLETCRVYSTVPDTYPKGVRKALPDTALTRSLKEAVPFVANSLEEIAGAYPDSETVRELGANNLVNLPIVYQGRVLGLLCVAGSGAPRPPAFATSARPFAQVLGPVLAASSAAPR